jgi:hypothetical protein
MKPVSIICEDNETQKENVMLNFTDFSEPNVLKSGYLIPLQCGHNGNWNK